MSERSIASRIAARVRRHLREPLEGWLRRRENAGRTYQPLFISGAMGSGTTLVAFEIGHRFDVAGVVEESALQVSRSSFMRAGLVADFDSTERYLASLYPSEGWSESEAIEALQRMYRTYADRGGLVIVDKGPNANLVRAAFLARCFPESRFLLVFRDPVVTIEGFRRKWPLFASEPLEASIAFFESAYQAFLDQTIGLGDRVVAISYEGLVVDRERTMRQVGERVGLDSSGSERHLAERPNVPGQGIRNVIGNSIGIVRDANRKAYSRMDDADVARIKDALGPIHDRLERMAINRFGS